MKSQCSHWLNWLYKWQYGTTENCSMLNFSERKRNETPNSILNMVHIFSLNLMILKPEDITGKKSCKQILMQWKTCCKKAQTKPREHPCRRALAGLSKLYVYIGQRKCSHECTYMCKREAEIFATFQIKSFLYYV